MDVINTDALDSKKYRLKDGKGKYSGGSLEQQSRMMKFGGLEPMLNYTCYFKIQTVTAIKQGRIRWAGHINKMPEDRAVKKVFTTTPRVRRGRGQQKVDRRYRGGSAEDRGQRWRRMAQDRDKWRNLVVEVQVPQSCSAME